MSNTKNFEGHVDRECGEHRTTGNRAWCFECTQWCYGDDPCRGCELPALRKSLADAFLRHVTERDELQKEIRHLTEERDRLAALIT